jgi:DNA-binding MarR family transcriptional regulator
MTVGISGLGDHIGFWLRFVSNAVSQSFARKVEEKGVTVAEWALMRALFDSEAAPPSKAAEQLGMTRGAITKLADRLIGKGLLIRRADPDDGRARTLALTARARRLVPELAALADENDAAFFGDLPAKERARLERLLKSIVARRGLKHIPID